MRWSTFRDIEGVERVGVWDDDGLHPVPMEVTLLDLIRSESLAATADEARSRPAVDPSTVTLLPPIPRPPSIRDFMAFEDHVVTSFAAIGVEVDPLWYRQPVFYFTNPAAVRGAHDPIPVSPGSAAFDYELEIAAVIGRAGADLDPAAAVDHIAGYMLFCDWSARDLQSQEMRLNLGPAKGKDSAHSCGPWMLTPDELPAAAAMTASVNGRPYSTGRLDALYWSFGEMIAYASRGTQVVPGDLIGSGTVGTGCILELSRTHGADAYPLLRPGDAAVVDGAKDDQPTRLTGTVEDSVIVIGSDGGGGLFALSRTSGEIYLLNGGSHVGSTYDVDSGGAEVVANEFTEFLACFRQKVREVGDL